jgi:hypothetical protein
VLLQPLPTNPRTFRFCHHEVGNIKCCRHKICLKIVKLAGGPEKGNKDSVEPGNKPKNKEEKTNNGYCKNVVFSADDVRRITGSHNYDLG